MPYPCNAWLRLRWQCVPIALLALACLSLPSSAWTITGHRTVVEIAIRYLSQPARDQIGELLDRELDGLADLAMWADETIEERPETESWHTVDIPHGGGGYNRERDCRYDDCIVERIKDFAGILADRRQAKWLRLEALKFVLHFVGDLHVPVHAYAPGAPEDIWRPWKGWEGPWVRIGDETVELHDWWDWHFLARMGLRRNEIAGILAAQITADEQAAWVRGSPEDWANESFQIARAFVIKYRLIDPALLEGNSMDKPIVLGDAAAAEATAIVVQRLKMAGVRLAWLLSGAME